jgi:hypothetical protein
MSITTIPSSPAVFSGCKRAGVWLRRTLERDPRPTKQTVNCMRFSRARFVGKRPTASGGGHGQGWP